MNYRSGCLRKRQGIRERPVPEWRCCMVYNPATRKLVKLNLSAWLIFELCTNRRFRAIEEQYLTRTGSRIPSSLARRQLNEALDHLLTEGLVEIVPSSPT